MNLYRVLIYEGERATREKVPGYFTGDPQELLLEDLISLCSVISYEKIQPERICGVDGKVEEAMREFGITLHKVKLDAILLNGFISETSPSDYHKMVIDMDWKFAKNHYMRYKYDLVKRCIRDCKLKELI